MKKLIIAIISCAVCALAADYTPVTAESPVIKGLQVNEPQTVTYTATWTNGTILTPTSSLVIISASGLTNTAVRTAVLAVPTAAGQKLTLYCAAVSNLPTIADSGTVNLSAAWAPGVGDTLSLQSINTSTWVEVGRVDN